VYQPASLKDAQTQQRLRALAQTSCGGRLRLIRPRRSAQRVRASNASLLARWRGAARYARHPRRDARTGISIMKWTGLDTVRAHGGLAHRADDTSASLHTNCPTWRAPDREARSSGSSAASSTPSPKQSDASYAQKSSRPKPRSTGARPRRDRTQGARLRSLPGAYTMLRGAGLKSGAPFEPRRGAPHILEASPKACRACRAGRCACWSCTRRRQAHAGGAVFAVCAERLESFPKSTI